MQVLQNRPGEANDQRSQPVVDSSEADDAPRGRGGSQTVPGSDADARRARRPVRRWLIPLLSAIVALVGVNVAVLLLEPYLLHLNMYRFQYTGTRIADYYHAPRPNVVFMGSSRALNAFS